LKLAYPIFAFAGDRFVLRDASERYTIAGGVVLDPDGANYRGAAQLRLLSMRTIAPDDVDVCVRSEITLREFVPRTTLLNKSHFSAGQISEALMRLKAGNEIVLREKIAADGEFWKKLRTQAIAVIDEAHKQNPERLGLDLNVLRSELRVEQLDVFEALIAELCAQDFVRKGAAIARTSHHPVLPVKLRAAEGKIREALSQKPFDPPPRRELEPDLRARQILRFLIENGDAIEIDPDVILLRESFERMKSRIAEFISRNGPAAVSQLRQALGSSRRIMVPLLEKLDRDGVTRRIGDRRGLR
jgi:selenocysteine-specific elongation factor